MIKTPKVVLDTNIFVSMLLGSKNCIAIRQMFAENSFDIVISGELTHELLLTINHPKFRNVFSANDKNILIKLLETDAELVFPSAKLNVCRDKNDNIVVECATEAKADFIVSGDKDLLDLKNYAHTKIITPAKFIELLKK